MAPGLNDVIAAIENLKKPIVAAIFGTALGGGLETSMGCHYRCAVASAKCGQPEVNLGLILLRGELGNFTLEEFGLRDQGCLEGFFFSGALLQFLLISSCVSAYRVS